ncbi:MAG: zeta toxin family protein [Alphaproteobacteria bacterium]|nr:zeta toxin family protein [Alphaproteobacteria bacterium]
MEEIYKLSHEEHEEILKEIMKNVFKGAKPQEKPKIFIMGGQPGAGKSTFINQLINSEEGKDCLIINADEYRAYHPKIKEIYTKHPEEMATITDLDVRDWTQRIFALAIQNRNNIIFEGTMRTPQICETIKDLHSKGYEVNVHVMAVNFYESKLSTYSRYEEALLNDEMPRHTPPEAHDETYGKMLKTLQQIEDDGCYNKITIHGRDKDVNLTPKEGENRVGSVMAILKHREKVWSRPKLQQYENWADNVISSMQNRGETRYISQVEELKTNAKQMTIVPAQKELSSLLLSLQQSKLCK